MSFELIDATINDIHSAYANGSLTICNLVETYLERIDRIDSNGPKINSIINTNPAALDEAKYLDKSYRDNGLVGPLHGIPIVFKDQGDVDNMPTTLGSILFEKYKPGRDCTVAKKLKAAGAIIIAKTTLGELGAGDTHGTLFGSTKNVYHMDRTAGGSSGGTGAAVSANLCAAGIGQEGFASIRRPSIWNGICGMRPTAGLVSRHGVYAGWPMINGSLGPMCRSIMDSAKILDVIVGFDEQDPLTARGVGKVPASYSNLMDANALKGARLGILRTPMGFNSNPAAEDFIRISHVLDRAVGELENAGATIIDDIEIPNLNECLSTRTRYIPDEDEAFERWLNHQTNAPFHTRSEIMASKDWNQLRPNTRARWELGSTAEDRDLYHMARQRLATTMMAVMAQHKLDAIVHKAVEHEPTTISSGIKPPYVDQAGAPHLNTFLIYASSVVVPAGFTSADQPAGITFLGKSYQDHNMLRYAYAYEQSTKHRRAPKL
tara:strand:+ start:1127 stop:2599 length:1473 start_codon:yes stop_codon:yes gene_type:complete